MPLYDPALYLNRELSWLEFNQRVLDEALDPPVPVLERLKFLAISASNLDEFYMVRVAGLKQQIASDVGETPADGLRPSEQLARISTRTQRLVAEQYRGLRESILPGLRDAGTRLLRPDELDVAQRKLVAHHYDNQLYPALTPLAVDPGHPFPQLRNRSLNLAVALDRGGAHHGASFGVVQVPSVLGRYVELPHPEARHAYLLLEDAIALHLGDLFPGTRILGAWAFRVTRNFDLSYDEDESADLLKTIQKEVRRRERGNAVRLEIDHRADPAVRRFLIDALRLGPDDVYAIEGPLHLADLMSLTTGDHPRASRDEPMTPQEAPRLRNGANLFNAIAQGDVLLHHPYETFEHVIDFIEQAADDPDVLAIKQTLYRTSGDSAIVKALARAAEAGKQVTALVELKARFDEEANIQWARALEEAGVHVVYGLIGLKTHCKLALVVRRESAGIRRYVHLSTGNYNPATARLYTDLSYFTCREAHGADATALFNLLTGYSQPHQWDRFVVAPIGLHEWVIERIEREAQRARAGESARIIAKMNALVDPEVIRALYRASQAGVKIDLLVRGICCLRPGVEGVSENIRVTSIVDRFLEHARVYFFAAGGADELYLASADWMPRNFIRRVELAFPIDDQALKARILDEILPAMLADNQKARTLRSDGQYERTPVVPGAEPRRSQAKFIEAARLRAERPPVEPRLRPAVTPLRRNESPIPRTAAPHVAAVAPRGSPGPS